LLSSIFAIERRARGTRLSVVGGAKNNILKTYSGGTEKFTKAKEVKRRETMQ
jgi:hypothetical protein